MFIINLKKQIIFIIIFVLLIPLTGSYSQEMLVKFVDHKSQLIDIPHNGFLNFNNIPAADRSNVVNLKIISNDNTKDLMLTDKPKIVSLSGTTDFIVNDNVSLNTPITTTGDFELSVQFSSTAKDGQLKRAQLKIYNNSSNSPYIINIQGNAKSQGVMIFKEPGTYSWKSLYDVTATITLMGGGQAGQDGEDCQVATSYNGNVTYRNGNGGYGGTSGENRSFQENLLSNTIYTITVGIGGTGNAGAGGDSKIEGGGISKTARGGLRNYYGEVAGGNGSSFTTSQSGGGGAGGDFTGDDPEFDLSAGSGAPPKTTDGNGGNGGNAIDNSGNGGGGGAGGNNEKNRSIKRLGGDGGKGGSGYVKIEWEGFIKNTN